MRRSLCTDMGALKAEEENKGKKEERNKDPPQDLDPEQELHMGKTTERKAKSQGSSQQGRRGRWAP